ncbi:PRC-barrel domain-containing protein [Streptomyces sp. NPDC002088]|uniref:PRC-barrel domain-containing protein n=1 Tax=Streptomyces sp. NPDC002088 TaxID=3154665 RepID=UPI003321FE96
MIQAADIREWRDHDVVDAKGRKIGVLEAIYVDTTTDEPAVATVRAGLPTRHRQVFVSLDEAVLGPGYLKVSYAKSRRGHRLRPMVPTRRPSLHPRPPSAACRFRRQPCDGHTVVPIVPGRAWVSRRS